MVIIEVSVLNCDGGFFQIVANLVRFDNQLIIARTFIFPKQIVVAVVIFSDSRLDALSKLARANSIEVFTEIGEHSADK